MSSFYIQLISNEVPKNIIQLGQKLFLAGAVVMDSELGIANFREYKVLESNQNYVVRTPIWHIALTTRDSDKIQELITQYTSCDCPYFAEVGICKHICGVFDSLESEFIGYDKVKLETEKFIPKKDIINSKNLISDLFDFEQNKWQQQQLVRLDSYFNKNSGTIVFWEDLVIHLKKTPAKKFLSTISSILQTKSTEYENEKKILGLLETAFLLDHMTWMDIIVEVLEGFTTRNQYKFWGNLWRKTINNSSLNNNEIRVTIKGFLASQSEEYKEGILDFLKSNYESSPQLWLQFIMDSKFERFILSSIDSYDPELMLDIIEILPEQRELIEQKITNKVKIWLDFLITGEYKELEQFLLKWKILGRSYYLEKVIEYIRQNHSKKRSLIKFLENL
jgi:hypothetical protein